MKKLLILILLFVSIISCYCQTAEEYIKSGNTKKSLKDYKGAIVDYTKALELDPLSSRAYALRSWVKVTLGDYRGAIIDDNTAIEIDSKNGNAYLCRGMAWQGLGNRTQGCLDFSRAGELGIVLAYDYINALCK